MPRIYVFGYSHNAALREAAAADATAFSDPIKFVHALAGTGRTGADAQPVRDGRLDEMLLRALQPDNRDRVTFSTIGGNAHHFITLMEHPSPFDFILPEEPDLPVLGRATLLPYDFMWEVLRGMAAEHMTVLRALRTAIDGPIVHLESPPPIGDVEHILKYPDIFAARRPNCPVADRIFRYKAWRLNSAVERSVCDELGIPILAAPREAMDDQGFLRPEGYPEDPTHGNGWYGAFVLKQMQAYVADMAACPA